MHHTYKNFCPHTSQSSVICFQLSSFCSNLVTMTTMKILWLLFLICLYDCVKSFIILVCEITKIWRIVSFFIMSKKWRQWFYCSPFLCRHWKKNNISIFFSHILTLEIHISRTACQIWWHIYISFFVVFQALRIKATCIWDVSPLWRLIARITSSVQASFIL